MGEEKKERPPKERLLIEAKLRRRLEVAQAKHKQTVEELHRLHDRPDRTLPETKQAHRNAIDAYRAALTQLNDFILHGTDPGRPLGTDARRFQVARRHPQIGSDHQPGTAMRPSAPMLERNELVVRWRMAVEAEPFCRPPPEFHDVKVSHRPELSRPGVQQPYTERDQCCRQYDSTNEREIDQPIWLGCGRRQDREEETRRKEYRG